MHHEAISHRDNADGQQALVKDVINLRDAVLDGCFSDARGCLGIDNSLRFAERQFWIAQISLSLMIRSPVLVICHVRP